MVRKEKAYSMNKLLAVSALVRSLKVSFEIGNKILPEVVIITQEDFDPGAQALVQTLSGSGAVAISQNSNE